MKNRLPVYLLVNVLFLISSCSQKDYDVILERINIVDVKSGEILKEQNVGIADGHIVELSGKTLRSSNDNTEIISGVGKYVFPGLCDSHTHLCFLTGKEGDSLQSELADFVRNGVLYVRDVGGPLDVMSHLKDQISTGELTGPDIYFTGPMLESSPLYWEAYNKDMPGFTVPLDTRADVDSVLLALAENNAPLLKTFNNIDTELYPYIVETAAKYGLKIVHDPGGPLFNTLPVEMALELGVTSIEHFFAPCSYLVKEEYRSEFAELNTPDADLQMQGAFIYKLFNLEDGFISEDRLNTLCDIMKEKEAVLCPTLRVMREEIKGIEEQELAGMGNEELTASKGFLNRLASTGDHIVRAFSANEVRLLVGQDHWTPEGTIEEMMLLSEAGVSPIEVLRGATLYAAEWLEIADKYGSIEPGKKADLVLVNSNPLSDIAHVNDVYMVIQHGKLVQR